MSSEIKDRTQLNGMQKSKKWTIQSALETDWTATEKNPPDDYPEWTIPVRLTPSDKLLQIIRICASSYGMKESVAVRKMLRYGLQEIVVEVEGEDFLDDCGDYWDAVTFVSGHVSGESRGFTHLQDVEKLSVQYGRSGGNNPESFRVIWLQRDRFNELSSLARTNLADIFRWGIFQAGVGLGEEGLIPEPLYQDAVVVVEEIENKVEERLRVLEAAAQIALNEAILNGYIDDVSEYCKTHTPNLWTDYTHKIWTLDSVLSDSEFLYGVGFERLDIEDEQIDGRNT